MLENEKNSEISILLSSAKNLKKQKTFKIIFFFYNSNFFKEKIAQFSFKKYILILKKMIANTKKKSKDDPDGPFFDASKLSKYSLRKYKLL